MATMGHMSVRMAVLCSCDFICTDEIYPLNHRHPQQVYELPHIRAAVVDKVASQ